MNLHTVCRPRVFAACALLLACGGGEAAKTPDTPTPSATPTTSGAQTPDAGGKVITIEMTTDDKGNNKFSPNDIEAHPGDVLRFTLVTGVHNVHFPADSNPGAAMPPAGQLLQLPGQTHDIKVTWAEGKYKFLCDPHALLGMTGTVEVEREESKRGGTD